MSNLSSLTKVEAWIEQRPFGWEFADPSTLQTFGFEEIDPFYWHGFIQRNWKLPLYFGSVYIFAIFGIQKYMKTRPAFELKWPLFLWNLCLGIFSVFGFLRTAPGFLSALSQPNGLYHSICTKQHMDYPTCYWMVMFALSKFWELGDTIFIVLRKRPLVFLQWYHHLIVMAGWWIAPLVEPIIRWTAVLNFGVHSFMYNYFALRAIGVRIPNSIANTITGLQLAQMIIGFGVNMASLYFLYAGENCVRYPVSMKIFGTGYFSFILLFGKLFYDSVLKKGKKNKKMEKLN